MVRRSKNRAPKLKSDKWKLKDGLYYLNVEDLLQMLAEARSPVELERVMGVGYKYITDLRDGKGLSDWSAWFVESALLPEGVAKEGFKGY